MDKLNFETDNFVKKNIEKIEFLFPNVITEMKDKDGKLKKGIDFEKLKQELSEEIIEGDERYDFTWVGRKASIVEANKPIRKTLRPCIEESKNWETTENLYIEGDNLEVLKLLQESYLNSIKMIYIDPPYNTGNDFIYKDNFAIGKDEYDEQIGLYDEEENRLFQNTESNGRFHSDWCSMMYPRLKLAYSLLSEDGVIFISIDDNEVHNLRMISDELFGEKNFIGNITWEKRTKCQNTETSRDQFQSKTEYILIYKKQLDRMRFNLVITGEKKYNFNDEKGPYREKIVEEMSSLGMRGRPTMIFPIKGIYPNKGKQWKIGQDQVKIYEDRNDILIKNNKIFLKIRPEDENEKKFAPFWSHFFNKEIYDTAETGKKELSNILKTKAHGFETVKPVNLLKKIIFHISSNKRLVNSSDIILDFFSGSATTAHAVMKLNAEDGGNRKFIMVNLPEPCSEDSEAYKAGYKNICDIGKERIRRAGEKIKSEIEKNNTQLKMEEEPKKVPDIGFRVFKVDSSNMKDVYYSADEYNQEMLSGLESNIKEDRKDLDLLYGIMLDWGLSLSLNHKIEKIDDIDIHIVDTNALIACFAEKINEKVVTEIAKKQPIRAVFKDSSFSSSPEKINIFEIFKLLAPATTIKVI